MRYSPIEGLRLVDACGIFLMRDCDWSMDAAYSYGWLLPLTMFCTYADAARSNLERPTRVVPRCYIVLLGMLLVCYWGVSYVIRGVTSVFLAPRVATPVDAVYPY